MNDTRVNLTQPEQFAKVTIECDGVGGGDGMILVANRAKVTVESDAEPYYDFDPPGTPLVRSTVITAALESDDRGHHFTMAAVPGEITKVAEALWLYENRPDMDEDPSPPDLSEQAGRVPASEASEYRALALAALSAINR